MASTTIVTYVCDKCGFTKTMDTGQYNFDKWFSVTIHTYQFNDPYIPNTDREFKGIYCPDCHKAHGTGPLVEHTVRLK